MSHSCDILIIGAGIAGASLAARLAGARQVTILEAEAQAGYHSTGRSASFWHETYGGAQVRPLTTASRGLLASPPPEFSQTSFLSPRSALTIAQASEATQLAEFIDLYRAAGVAIERVEGAALAAHIPHLRETWIAGAHEAECSDIDVASLHSAYLAQAQRAGSELVLNTRLLSARWQGGAWEVETNRGSYTARTLVNAAGAWAEAVASACGIAPIKIHPLRRTVMQLRLGEATPASLPLVLHIGGSFYFKGAGEGRVWLSPHDETPTEPCDAAPEEWDVALAIDRFQSVVDIPIAAVEHKWAGLRSFSDDRLPVFGRDSKNPEFVWCIGQGGFGIQTSPAISALLATQLGAEPNPDYADIDCTPYTPSRFV